MTDTLKVGDTITGEYLDSLPLTTRIEVGGSQWHRKPNGRWTESSWNGAGSTYGNYTQSQLLSPGDRATITFLPYEVERPGIKVDDQWESVFTTTVGSAAREYGINRDTLDQAFREIGVADAGPIEWRPGQSGWAFGMTVFQTLPAGSLVMTSDHYVYERADSEAPSFFRRVPTVENRHRNISGAWVVLRVGPDGPLEQIEAAPVTPEREAEIRRKKQRAWKVGMRMKEEHGWCSTLEAILQGGGVTTADASPPGLLRRQQRPLPEGTLLFWQNDGMPERWAVLRRNDASTNSAATEFVFGTRTQGYRDNAYPFWVPGEEWTGVPEFTVPDAGDAARVLANLPDQTVFMFGQFETYRVRDHRIERINERARERRYMSASRAGVIESFTPDDFGGSVTVTILYLPEEAR